MKYEIEAISSIRTLYFTNVYLRNKLRALDQKISRKSPLRGKRAKLDMSAIETYTRASPLEHKVKMEPLEY